jgi:hypothetical protein
MSCGSETFRADLRRDPLPINSHSIDLAMEAEAPRSRVFNVSAGEIHTWRKSPLKSADRWEDWRSVLTKGMIFPFIGWGSFPSIVPKRILDTSRKFRLLRGSEAIGVPLSQPLQS